MSERGRSVEALFAVLLFFLGGILLALFGPLAWAVTWGLLLFYLAAIWGGWNIPLGGMATRIETSPSAMRTLLCLCALVFVVGASELAAQAFTRFTRIEPPSPMKTLVPKGTEDWRLAHITADAYREPDPALLWRPTRGGPYNAQRFKGPIAEIPKPADVFRIMTYGDSNTDGPPTGAWPEQLQQFLNTTAPKGTRFEVLNAGVAGYSSYQGLVRLREEISIYTPDLVVVSFGWNDLADALGQPDQEFETPSELWLATQRLLLQFRFYRLLRSEAPPPDDSKKGPRVPLADYIQNIQHFRELTAENNADILFLTRVTRSSTEQLRRRSPNWRAQVPEYNAALLELGARTQLPVLDVQTWFQKNHPGAFVDESHLSAEGRTQMAQLLSEYLSATPRGR